MNETEVNSILEKLDIQLQEMEEVVEIIENKYENTNSIVRALNSFGYSTWVFLAKHFESFEPVVEDLRLLRSDLYTVFTNQRLVLPNKKSISWMDVYRVNELIFDERKYIVFDLQPDDNQYHGVINDSMSKLIDDPEYIALRGFGNPDEISEKISPYWQKNGAPRELVAVKQNLIDKFNMKISRKQNNLEMLTAKYDDFTINYTHKSIYPANLFQVSVKFKEPISAFLNISMEKIGSKLIQAIGFKDIEIGNEFIDKMLNIQGSHQDEIQTIFSQELNVKLRQLLREGTFDLTFGEPINKKQLKSGAQKNVESEEVLDIQLATNNKSESTSIEFKGHTTLAITISTINDRSLYKENIQQFTQTFIEVALHFANGLKTLQ